jgi:hypothetical protein
MKYDAEVKEIISIQKDVETKQQEVSRRISDVLRKIKKDHITSVMGIKFIIDGELWEVDRWDLEQFNSWCLKCRGEVLL